MAAREREGAGAEESAVGSVGEFGPLRSGLANRWRTIIGWFCICPDNFSFDI